MPTKPDPVFKVEQIYSEFGALARRRGEVSEADTRANIIDRLIHDVLGWPHAAVNSPLKKGRERSHYYHEYGKHRLSSA